MARVSEHSIRWIVDRFHVGTPDEDIKADVRRRCARMKLTEAQTRRAVKFAVKVHHENRDLYRRVTAGRI